MLDLLQAKKVYKQLYCLNLPNLEIYFRLPSWKDYQTYISVLDMGLMPFVYLYEEIFKSIVIDESIVEIMYQLPAGVVDAVVSVAMKLAGNPLKSEDDINLLNQDIDIMRGYVQSNIYEQFKGIICRVFPRYSPIDLEDLAWPEVLKLLLMAEKILVEEGKIEGGVNVKPLEKPKTLTNQIAEDLKKYREVDTAPPPMVNKREAMQEGGDKRELSPQQQVQLARAEKAKARMNSVNRR